MPGEHAKDVGDVCSSTSLSVAGGCAGPSGGARPVGSIQRRGIAPLSAADVVCAPEWPDVAAWAKTRANRLVGLYFFGSRMRGDHGPESDMDIALVIREGARVQTRDLPESIAGIAVDWVPLSFERVCVGLRRMGIPWIIASRGIRLWGQALPPVDSALVEGAAMRNIEEARHDVLASLNAIKNALGEALIEYHPSLPDGPASSGTVAAQTASASEMVRKAVLALRGLEPTRSHSVEELYAVIRHHDPEDPLLPLLERLNGATKAAHTADYFDTKFVEPFGTSLDRVASTMDALTAVVEELGAYPGESPFSAGQQNRLNGILEQVQENAERLCSRTTFGNRFERRVIAMTKTVSSILPGREADSERCR